MARSLRLIGRAEMTRTRSRRIVERDEEPASLGRRPEGHVALLALGMPNVDPAHGVGQKHFLGLGCRDAMPELRLPPVGRVPVQSPEPADHQPHGRRVIETRYIIDDAVWDARVVCRRLGIGPASRSSGLYAGMLAACLSRWDDAERHFADALAMNERLGARPYVVRTRRAWASMLLDRNAPGDAARARDLIAAGRAEAETLGMARELARFDRLLPKPCPVLQAAVPAPGCPGIVVAPIRASRPGPERTPNQPLRFVSREASFPVSVDRVADGGTIRLGACCCQEESASPSLRRGVASGQT